VGIKNIGSFAKNTKRSKNSQALPRQAGAGRMTILWENRKRNRRSLHYASLRVGMTSGGVVTFIRGRQIGWTEETQQVQPPLRDAVLAGVPAEP
jgi:hypothetical protein